ncbi:unnamed protein product [Coffea canephora]|uniref:WRKY domain-containing protein n=1 Tax=Coffea canephora TaxID=49390 RepID=A0A068U994_COFCA|nr:unnamed protein product [Coffea canephora]
MADDWDLYAVVRSCFNAAATSTASSSTTTDAAIAPVENSSLPSGETSLSSSFLASPSFQSGHTSSDFPGFANHTRDSFRGLEEIYKEPYEDIVQSFVDLNSQAQHIQAIQGPGCTADQTPQQQRIYGQPQQLMQQPQRYSHLSREMFVGASLSFPSTSPQPERPRRRKNQQAKRIQQMTQEELSADSWAWRKYGQKPIKDSPYPRNYYRCSTSKGCTARKQVERCPADPSMYVVSYSGEHSHPRPTHRSSLAGTTRSKPLLPVSLQPPRP